jgi:predicted nucleic acid-binding protein
MRSRVVVVSNSSSLIALARIQRLDVLAALFRSILIPPAVAREIEPSIQVLPDWLSIRSPIPAPAVRDWAPVSGKALVLGTELKPELDALVRTSFFLSQQLYDKLLLAGRENDS